MNGFAVVKKALIHRKKTTFVKKFLPAYLLRYDLENGVLNFFKKINGS